MAYSSQEHYLVTDHDMSQGYESDLIDCLDIDMGAVQIYWNGNDAVDATMRLEVAVRHLPDGTVKTAPLSSPLNQKTISSLGTAVNGSHVFDIWEISWRYFKFIYEPGTNTSGTLDVAYILKSRK